MSREVQDPAPVVVESAAAKARSGKSPSSGKAATPAAGNEGATIARRLAAALVKPGVDSSLDCELGIMRALTERNQQATDIPIELLREWTLVAVQRRDCGLLGRAMTLASAAGHSMAGLLGGFGSLASVLCEITSVFSETSEARESSSSSGSSSSSSSENDAKTSDGTSATSSPTPPCPILPMGAAGAPPQSGLPSLPASMCWLHDHSAGAQLGLVKHVVNGVATFFSNKAFESYVVSRENLQASWQAKGRPSTELFIHPDDVFKVCSHVGRLWKGLAPTVFNKRGNGGGGAAGGGEGSVDSTAGEAAEEGGAGGAGNSVKECAREVPDAVRLWVTWPRGGYVHCRARVHLVVTATPNGQISHLAFGFRAQATQPPPDVARKAAPVPKPAPKPTLPPPPAPPPVNAVVASPFAPANPSFSMNAASLAVAPPSQSAFLSNAAVYYGALPSAPNAPVLLPTPPPPPPPLPPISSSSSSPTSVPLAAAAVQAVEPRPRPPALETALNSPISSSFDWVHIASEAVGCSQPLHSSATNEVKVPGKAAAETASASQAILPKQPARSDGTLPTPPAHGVQFFGGEDEEFWDAVTMLATD